MPAGMRSWVCAEAVVLSSTDTVLENVPTLKLATIKSGLPSPLTSAAFTEDGSWPPALNACWVAKLACGATPERVCVEQHRHRVDVVIRDDQIRQAVSIHIGRRHRTRDARDSESLLGRKAGYGGADGSGVEQHRDRTVAEIRDDQVRLPVPVRRARRHRRRFAATAKVCWAAKLGVVAPGAVVLSSTDTVPLPNFARDTRAGQTVAILSATAHRQRRATHRECLLGSEAGRDGTRSRRVEQHRDRAGVCFRSYDQVGLAVAIYVGSRLSNSGRCSATKTTFG